MNPSWFTLKFLVCTLHWGSWSRALNFHCYSVSQGTGVWTTLVNTVFLRFLSSCFCCSLRSSEGYFMCKDVLTLTCCLTPFKKKPFFGGSLFNLSAHWAFVFFLLVWNRDWMLMAKSLDFFQAIYFGASSQSVGIDIYQPPCHTLSSPQYDIYFLHPVGRVEVLLKIPLHLSTYRGFLGRHPAPGAS